MIMYTKYIKYIQIYRGRAAIGRPATLCWCVWDVCCIHFYFYFMYLNILIMYLIMYLIILFIIKLFCFIIRLFDYLFDLV